MAARSRSWIFPAACLLALALVLGAYSNFYRNAFHFDDSHVIEENLYIRSLSNVPLFWTDATTSSSHPPNAVYRPLLTTTLALDHWLAGGLEVWQFRVSQLTMLVVLGILLFFFFRWLLDHSGGTPWTRGAALFAATFFCLHTTNTETMNIVAVRAELLSAIGLVGSFLVYLYLPSSRRAHLYLVPMAIGAFAKSPSVVFAPLFLVYLLLYEEGLAASDLLTGHGWRSVGRALRRSLPAFVVGLALFLFIESMNAPSATYAGGDRVRYLQTQAFVWLHYARLFLLPVGLTADTDWTLIHKWYDTRVLAGVLFVGLLLAALWTTSRRPGWRPVAFGIAWFVIGLLPASSVFPLAEVANEHRIFLPYIGLSLSLAATISLVAERLLQAWPRRRRATLAAAAVLAVAFVGGNAIGTYQRNRVWRSGETLWRDVTEKSPLNGRGLMNYGLSQMAQGRYQEAKRLFDRARVLTPNYATLEVNLGIVTARLGQPAEAQAHFETALRLRSGDPSPYVFYARWLAEEGRHVEAIPLLERALELSPADLAARHQLLDAYARMARKDDLKALATATLALAPNDAGAKKYLDESGEVVLTAVDLSPAVETPEALLNTSLRLYQARDYEGSLRAARRALELKPGYAEAYNNLAAAFASMQRWDEAIEAAQEALRLRPDFTLARNNLAWAETEKQKSAQGAKGGE